MTDDVRIDWHRSARAGIPEVVFAESKCAQQLMDIAEQHIARSNTLFMTRVSADKARALAMHLPGKVHVHEQSCTVFIGEEPLTMGTRARVAIVAAGTSDMPVVTEIEQSLLYLGEASRRYVDVGVAGLWRLTELADELSAYSVIVAVAGMEGALFSVLAGLVPAPVIAVPVSVGYGVGEGGHVALGSALSSCSPGIAVVNIDNGFGAAALAVKMLGAAITR